MKNKDQITDLQFQKANLEAMVANLSRKVQAGSEGNSAQSLAEHSLELQKVNDALKKALAENPSD